MYSTLTSGFCSMKRLTFASTTWGSKAHPAKRTRASPRARRGDPAIASPTPALAREALRRKARRETVARGWIGLLMTAPPLGCGDGRGVIP